MSFKIYQTILRFVLSRKIKNASYNRIIHTLEKIAGDHILQVFISSHHIYLIKYNFSLHCTCKLFYSIYKLCALPLNSECFQYTIWTMTIMETMNEIIWLFIWLILWLMFICFWLMMRCFLFYSGAYSYRKGLFYLMF